MASQSVKVTHTASFLTRIRRQRRTCIQCTKTKRKCDKTTPSCVRCSHRGIPCEYPPRRNPLGSSSSESASYTGSRPGQEDDSDKAAVAVCLTRTSSSPAECSSASSTASVLPGCGWFLSTESWALQHASSAPGHIDVIEGTLRYFINKLKEWAATWTRDGHSPLIHRQSYRGWMPDCLQDAYTSLAAYDAASLSGKATTLRIIEDRANRLVQNQPQDGFGVGDELSSALLLDTGTHLARTQALFIYELIRLFDGDIRVHAQAEAHLETLAAWAQQMLETARLDCATAELMLAATDTTSNSIDNRLSTTTNPLALPPYAAPPAVWQAWIRAESVRRVYVAAVVMQAIYHTLKHGWSICPGLVSFTAQNGLWDATSEYTWLSALREGQKQRHGDASGSAGDDDGGGAYEGLSPWVMVQAMDSWGILQGAMPEDVDEFAVGMLEVTYGVESVEKWFFEKGALTRGRCRRNMRLI